jgi:hypothetical protein
MAISPIISLADPLADFRPCCIDSNLYVIASVFNPQRYKSRISLYNKFKKYIEDSGAKLFTVEVSLGTRNFVVTTPNNPMNLQLVTNDELWFKERMINLAIARLPLDWRYVAWIDADVQFARPDWAHETVELLQHFPIIQMFSTATDMCPKHGVLHKHTGFAYAYNNTLMTEPTGNYLQWHPGFAWAARRDALDDLGGLLDLAILGSADRHIAYALLGWINKSCSQNMHSSYFDMLNIYEERAKLLRGNLGYMDGNLSHYWHGRKAQRGYQDRWKILVRNRYNPFLDVKNDWQGLLQFSNNKPQLRYEIRQYFQSRNEDSIDQ